MSSRPVAELPHVDEHAITVAVDPSEVWPALLETVARAFSGRRTEPVAAILGCAERTETGGRPLHAGAALPGFRVERALPERELALVGRHRFSRYALIFRIDRVGPGRSRIRAETRAVFPGAAGRIYRALVIGTGGHLVVVRRLLAAVERRAERAHPEP